MSTVADDSDATVVAAGYVPVLRRHLGRLSSFAVSFSLMSITTGIFANYGLVLTTAGPFGYWTWLLVGAGQTLVALVFAEMASRIPLAGYAYNWNSRLANPMVGWVTGWLGLCFYCFGVAATSSTAVPVLGAMMGYPIAPEIAPFLVSGIILTQTVINVIGVRLTSHANLLAVIAEIVVLGLVGVAILALTLTQGRPNVELLFTIPDSPVPYWPAFLMAALMGAWTFVGFEAAADLSEETHHARRIAPFGVISSIVISVIVGFVFIAIMTVAIPDVTAIAGADNPLAAIMTLYLGSTATTIFLAFVLVAVFSCSLVTMAAASRLIFAMARDGRFVAPGLLARTSRQHVPANAIILVSVVAIILTFNADSVTSLYGAVAVLAAMVYLITVVSFAVGAKGEEGAGHFHLGRFRWPIIVLAVLWLLAEIAILTVPEQFHTVAIASGATLAAGLILYPIIGRRRPIRGPKSP